MEKSVDELTEKQKRELSVLKAALLSRMTTRNLEALTSVLGDRSTWLDGWKSSDKPDFVKCVGDVAIGLEHFAVNGFSENKDGSIQPVSNIVKGEFQSLYRAGNMALSNGSFDDALRVFSQASDLACQSSFTNRYVGDKYALAGLYRGLFGDGDKLGHAQKVDTKFDKTDAGDKSYRDYVQSKYPEKSAKVGLLIEFSGDFSYEVLFDGYQYCVNKSGLLPMSHWLLLLLSAALAKGVDFIILYRVRYDRLSGEISDSKLFVLSEPLDDILGYIHGEPVYWHLPAMLARYGTNTMSTYVRRRNVGGKIDIVHNVSANVGINVPLYWRMVYQGLRAVQTKTAYYSDANMVATIYALCGISHTWNAQVYVDSDSGEREEGIAPYGFDLAAFSLRRRDFFAFVDRHLPKCDVSDFECEAHVGLPAGTIDINDASNGVWVKIGESSGILAPQNGSGKRKKKNPRFRVV